MPTLGTAGHVDHGKSTLVEALTGIDPDRLAEEKQRGMTIDLGFAWLDLADGRVVGVVDVPGHQDFIRNMLVGVGGIDLALLVIAADEGVMPQTREHLGILNLLGLTSGVVALTKRDLVDADWLALVQAEVQATLDGTSLAGAPLIPVSAKTGAGLDDLRAAIATALPAATVAMSGVPRLAVDRVFTMAGFGTVVTGTLLGGTLQAGQEIVALPQGKRGRIRGIQSHHVALAQAQPGTRVALNLSGISHHEIARGTVIAPPVTLTATRSIDLRLTVWHEAPYPVSHNDLVEVFIGTAMARGRLRLLAMDTLAPGEAGWVQLELERPIVVARGDHCIVRKPTPSALLGGGVVVALATPHHRRHHQGVLAQLATLASGDVGAIVQLTLASGRGETVLMTPDDLATQTGFAVASVRATLATLVAAGTVLAIGDGYIETAQWASLQAQSTALLDAYHTRLSLRGGMPREEWRTRLRVAPRFLDAVIAHLHQAGAISTPPTPVAVWGAEHPTPLVALPSHMPRYTAEQAQVLAATLDDLQRAGLNPPPAGAIRSRLDGEMLAAAIEQGKLIRLDGDILLEASTAQQACADIVIYLRAHSSAGVAELRDHLGTSRRVIVPLIEALDAAHITRRQGDVRVLGLNAPESPDPPVPEPRADK